MATATSPSCSSEGSPPSSVVTEPARALDQTSTGGDVVGSGSPATPQGSGGEASCPPPVAVQAAPVDPDFLKPDGMSKNQWKKIQRQRRKELNLIQWKLVDGCCQTVSMIKVAIRPLCDTPLQTKDERQGQGEERTETKVTGAGNLLLVYVCEVCGCMCALFSSSLVQALHQRKREECPTKMLVQLEWQ